MTGCGDKTSGGKTEGTGDDEGQNQAVKPEGPREFDRKDLPEVEPMGSPVDDGRILVSQPPGWAFQPAGGLVLHLKDPNARHLSHTGGRL